MRAIRDNEVAANAMGKHVTAKHLQVFVLGSAVVGLAGAMLTTLDGQFTPASYLPLRFTFPIWIMVIVGVRNNFGSILGGFVIWFFWVESEPLGLWLMDVITSPLAETSGLRSHLLASAAHMRLMTMGLLMLLMLRFAPQGLIGNKNADTFLHFSGARQWDRQQMTKRLVLSGWGMSGPNWPALCSEMVSI